MILHALDNYLELPYLDGKVSMFCITAYVDLLLPLVLLFYGLAFLIVVAAYMLPFCVAAYFRNPNRDAIGVLNLFLGWSGIGWVIALVWAFKKDR